MPRLYIKILTVAPGVSEFSEISEFSENSDNSESSEILKGWTPKRPPLSKSLKKLLNTYHLTKIFRILTVPSESTERTMLMPLTGAATLAPPRV